MNPIGADIWHSSGFAVTMVAEPGVIVALRSSHCEGRRVTIEV